MAELQICACFVDWIVRYISLNPYIEGSCRFICMPLLVLHQEHTQPGRASCSLHDVTFWHGSSSLAPHLFEEMCGRLQCWHGCEVKKKGTHDRMNPGWRRPKLIWHYVICWLCRHINSLDVCWTFCYGLLLERSMKHKLLKVLHCTVLTRSY